MDAIADRVSHRAIEQLADLGALLKIFVERHAERSKRIHDLNDKRLDDMRKAFEQALPLGNGRKARKKPKKR